MNTSQAPLHPVLRYPAQHPLAGLALRAVGTLPSGRVVWPIMGGSPDGEGAGGAGEGAAAGEQAGAAAGAAAGEAAGQSAEQAKASEADKSKAAAEGKVEDLPDWAQRIIKDTRTEAATNRAGKTAAEQKLTDQLDGIAKALGLKGEEKADPAKLAQQLNETQQQAREAAVQLAVYKTASKHQGDPDALLDSRGFLAKLTDLDPAAKDFADKVDAAIKDAVGSNPKLKATQAAGSSSADHSAGGSGESKARTPKSLTDAVGGHYGA